MVQDRLRRRVGQYKLKNPVREAVVEPANYRCIRVSQLDCGVLIVRSTVNDVVSRSYGESYMRWKATLVLTWRP